MDGSKNGSGKGNEILGPRKWTLGPMLCVALCGIITALQVAALEPSDFLVFSKGSVSIRPQVMSYTEFNDNIFYRSTNTVSDVVQGLTAGVRFLVGEDLPQANHFNLQYRADQSFYIDNSALNALQHRFKADIYFHSSRTTIEGADRLEFLSSTLAGGYSAVNGLKVNRSLGSDRYRLTYKLGQRMSVYIQGEHNSSDYDKGISLLDLRLIQGTGGFEWAYSENTSFFGEAYYGITEVTRNTPGAKPPGVSSAGGFIGARGHFTEKLSGLVKAGYDYYVFDSQTLTPGSTDSGSAPVVETDVTYQITERWNGTFLYSRKQLASPEYAGSAYVSDDVGVRFRGVLSATGKLVAETGTALAFYQFNPLPALNLPARDEVFWSASASLTWYLKPWMAARLEYQYGRLRSDSPLVIEYDQNRVSLSFAVGY